MSKKLLFVDDEIEFEKAIKQKFRKEIQSGEYEIVFTQNGETALETIEKNKDIDLLLTDLKMPAAQIQGAELIKKLDKKNISIKTIVISAYKDIPEYTEEVKKKVAAFISKPFQMKNLRETINRLLNNNNNNNSNVNKELINIRSLSGIARELPLERQIKLITYLIKNLDLKSLEKLEAKTPDILNDKIKKTKIILEKLEKELPNILKYQIEINREREEKRDELIRDIKQGKINPDILTSVFGNYEILEKYIPQDGNYYGPYYYFRWWSSEKKQLETRYLGKIDPRRFISKEVENCNNL